jgi:hypothetical protein
MNGLFFGGGAEGGFGVMVLLTITSAAVIGYFRRERGTENVWVRLVAPALSGVLLAGTVVLAVLHYGTLLGTAPGNPAAWLLPSAYGAAAAAGLCWGLYPRAWSGLLDELGKLGGGDGNRTRVQGFAGPCLSHSATPPQGRQKTPSGRRDSNPRPSPWQGDALPTEPRPRAPLVKVTSEE